MKRITRFVNRTTKASADLALDMGVLCTKLAQLSDNQVQNLAQRCYLTQKELREAEKAFDREFNHRIKAMLAEAKGT